MDYNPIAQVDINDAASQSGDSEVADRSSVEPAKPRDSAHESTAAVQLGLGHLIDSMNTNKSSDYEIIENDDYEEIGDPNESIAQTTKDCPSANVQQISTVAGLSSTAGAEIVPRSTSPEPLVRTSSDISIPLRHPTPDLQSLQGAYVGNIERLEKSAERLSMTSSDIGVELRRLDLEQKRRSSASSPHQGPESPTRQMSTGSLSNSIIAVNSAARSGGYSPGAFLSSPRGSILSGSRFRSTSVTSPLQDIQEPGQEEDMEINNFDDRDVPILTPRPLPLHLRSNGTGDELPNPRTEQEVPDRPLTAHSTDTYQQATNLFLDFDGVHFIPHPRETSQSHQLSLNRTPLATTAEAPKEPQAGQNMIYYPAPIPKFLNLPQRLSKQSARPTHEKRRTQLMDIITASDKKEPKVDEAGEQRISKRLSTLPPQLRASVFFDQPSSNISSLEVQLKDQSAVSTLDSILDASTHAPVSAFTDHPIAGSAGGKVYGSVDKKRASRLSLVRSGPDISRATPGPRESALFVPGEGLHAYSDTEAAERNAGLPHDTDSDDHSSYSDSSSSGTPSDLHDSERDAADDDDVSGNEETDYSEQMMLGRPTTLLAELEMRKQEQKQRTRTAAKAFPNGMHSTLLELDAVAQAQSNKRRQKHVTLAWEADASQDPNEADDEDIPLGLLYGNKSPAAEERPLGLMERREQEENEPLSRRRARLRGEFISPTMPNKRASTMTQLQSLETANSDSGDDGETLAQRLHRLKQEKKEKSKSIISAEFESEIMAELGKLHEPIEPTIETNKSVDPPIKVVDEEEETLGQRRKRLQAEAQKRPSPRNVRASRSMADILQAYPSSNAGVPMVGNTQSRQMSLNPDSNHTQRLSTGFTVPPSLTFHAGLAQTPGSIATHGYETQRALAKAPYNASFMPGVPLGFNAYVAGMSYPHNMTLIQQDTDPKQRDVIDRWRQSVVR